MALNLTPQQKMKYDVSFKYQKEYVKVARQKGIAFTAAFAAAQALNAKTAPAATKQLKAMPKIAAKQVVTQQKKALGKIGPQLSAKYYYGIKSGKQSGGKKVTAQQIMAMPQFSTKAKIVAKLDKVKPGHKVKSTSRKAVWAKALAQAMSIKGKKQYVVDKSRRGKNEPTEGQRKDARRIRFLMEKGIVIPQGGIINPSDFGDSKKASGGSISKTTFKKYIRKYKGQVKAAGLSTAQGRVGLRLKKSEMPQLSLKQLASGLPQSVGRDYYVRKGRTVKRTIGGGGRGPGKIRPIAKGTVSYSKLSTADKRKVAAFLAEGQGKVLRGPGARKKIVLQQLVQVNMTKKQLAGVKQTAKQQTKAQSKASSGVTTQQIMKKKYNTIKQQLKAKGYTGKLFGVKKQVLAQKLAKLS